MKIFWKWLIAFSSLPAVCFISSCAGPEDKPGVAPGEETTSAVAVPSFDPDSAYHYVERQVSFGPRIPNTPAHKACAEYLAEFMGAHADSLILQRATLRAHDGTPLESVNLIALFRPELPRRVLLCAHWDTRPAADRDPLHPGQPSDGASDGASGVAILMEIARLMAIAPLPVGVDIIFFDAEDYGIGGIDNSYCLGSQHWARNPHQKKYFPLYGILLDMAGARNATFGMEGNSMRFAPAVVKKVWNTASRFGYSRYFIYQNTQPVTDDHYYINTLAKIPCIDILHHDFSSPNGFPFYWHTLADNLENIDPQTLKAVGQTLLEVIYREE